MSAVVCITNELVLLHLPAKRAIVFIGSCVCCICVCLHSNWKTTYQK